MLLSKRHIIFLLLISAAVSAQTVVDSTAAADSTKPPAAEALLDFTPRPSARLNSLCPDSTALIASRYVSLGDPVGEAIGGYFYNLGSAGQPVYVSLFGSPAGEMALSYDELILNHPLSGLADLNMIPVESIGRVGILHTGDRPFGLLPLGTTLHVQSMSIADNPIRSQVGYRTGAGGYDDVDVRLGAKVSEKLWLDLGGAVRGYNGHLRNSLYDGHQINLKLNRRLGANWLLRYLLLANEHAAQIPLPTLIMGFQRITAPLQKEVRTDHALVLRRRNDLTAVLQYTIMDSDWRDQQRAVFNLQNDVRQWRGTVEWAPLADLDWRNGVTGWATWLHSNGWGRKADGQAGVYSSLTLNLTERLRGYGRLAFEQHDDFSPQVLPEVSLFWQKDSTLRATVWANRGVVSPSMQARYRQGALAWGDPQLHTASFQQLVAALERQRPNLTWSGAAALRLNIAPIAAQFDGERVVYAHLPDYSCLTFDAKADFRRQNWLLALRGQLYKQLNERPVIANRPSWYARGFLQYHLIAFRGDLNLRLRLGAELVGDMRAPIPWYAAVSSATVNVAPQLYPYVHALLHYHDADIFFSFENFVGADVQYVYGYPMPQQWLRWGFVWRFVD